ncbi:MAG: hypothetical protein KGN34_02450 [Sphingomonadales bacterium]|nr:hypothetical protein [Sphingomonadales bacterium]
MNPYESFTSARPSVHRLYYGAFIQASFQIDLNAIVIPMRAVGTDHLVDYGSEYHSQFFKEPLGQEARGFFSKHGQDSLPIISVVTVPQEDDEPSSLGQASRPVFDRAEQAISWISGNFPTPFMEFVALQSGVFGSFIPPSETRRLHLSFGDHSAEQQDRVDALIEAASLNERFSFGLSMYRDATHERNPQFQIARLFSVLESFAYALKGGGRGSRAAVRKMLGVESATGETVLADGRKIRFERIELAGRLRDKLFHGVPFEPKDLSPEWRDGFDLIQDHPEQLIHSLKGDCELEIARWASGASFARAAAESKGELSD